MFQDYERCDMTSLDKQFHFEDEQTDVNVDGLAWDTIMRNSDNRIENFEENDLNKYFELGNQASANGNQSESLQWFFKGRAKAIELKNRLKEREFSALIMIAM